MKVLAEIVTVGDELLIGQVVDTNSAWIGRNLNAIGVAVNRITSISDCEQEILSAIDEALNRVDIVLVTGGLGPTKDDITKKTLCKYFETELIFSQEAYDNMERVHAGRIQMNELNRQMAYIPKNAIVFQNRVGSAPICMFRKGNKILVSMPGVPQEMKSVMVEDVLPFIQSHFNTDFIIHHTFFVKNYPESVLAITLERWENKLPNTLKLAYLPQAGMMRLRLTAQGGNQKSLESDLERVEKELYKILGKDVFVEKDEPLEEQLGELLLAHNMTVSTAESCTGGTLASRISRIAGASTYYIGSVVSYSNDVKKNQLGVKEETLEQFGAVSEETAIEMVNGVCKNLKTTCGVATTGIAGPTGAVPGKPIGTIWIAVKCKDRVVTRLLKSDLGRELNIERTTNNALIMLLEELQSIK